MSLAVQNKGSETEHISSGETHTLPLGHIAQKLYSCDWTARQSIYTLLLCLPVVPNHWMIFLPCAVHFPAQVPPIPFWRRLFITLLQYKGAVFKGSVWLCGCNTKSLKPKYILNGVSQEDKEIISVWKAPALSPKGPTFGVPRHKEVTVSRGWLLPAQPTSHRAALRTPTSPQTSHTAGKQ